MKTAIKELLEKRVALNKEISKVEKAIEALQDLCVHEYLYEGHTSHEDYEVCKHCGDDRYI